MSKVTAIEFFDAKESNTGSFSIFHQAVDMYIQFGDGDDDIDFYDPKKAFENEFKQQHQQNTALTLEKWFENGIVSPAFACLLEIARSITRSPNHRKKLTDTSNTCLVYADTADGIGEILGIGRGDGQNLLGLAWMVVRNEIFQQQLQAAQASSNTAGETQLRGLIVDPSALYQQYLAAKKVAEVEDDEDAQVEASADSPLQPAAGSATLEVKQSSARTEPPLQELKRQQSVPASTLPPSDPPSLASSRPSASSPPPPPGSQPPPLPSSRPPTHPPAGYSFTSNPGNGARPLVQVPVAGASAPPIDQPRPQDLSRPAVPVAVPAAGPPPQTEPARTERKTEFRDADSEAHPVRGEPQGLGGEDGMDRKHTQQPLASVPIQPLQRAGGLDQKTPLPLPPQDRAPGPGGQALHQDQALPQGAHGQSQVQGQRQPQAQANAARTAAPQKLRNRFAGLGISSRSRAAYAAHPNFAKPSPTLVTPSKTGSAITDFYTSQKTNLTTNTLSATLRSIPSGSATIHNRVSPFSTVREILAQGIENYDEKKLDAPDYYQHIKINRDFFEGRDRGASASYSIQKLFPVLAEQSTNPPHITRKEVNQIFDDTALQQSVQANMIRSLKMMLHYWGLTIIAETKDSPLTIKPFQKLHWLTFRNPNIQHITRVLHSLQLMGLRDHAQALCSCLQQIHHDHPDRAILNRTDSLELTAWEQWQIAATDLFQHASSLKKQKAEAEAEVEVEAPHLSSASPVSFSFSSVSTSPFDSTSSSSSSSSSSSYSHGASSSATSSSSNYNSSSVSVSSLSSDPSASRTMHAQVSSREGEPRGPLASARREPASDPSLLASAQPSDLLALSADLDLHEGNLFASRGEGEQKKRSFEEKLPRRQAWIAGDRDSQQPVQSAQPAKKAAAQQGGEDKEFERGIVRRFFHAFKPSIGSYWNDPKVRDKATLEDIILHARGEHKKEHTVLGKTFYTGPDGASTLRTLQQLYFPDDSTYIQRFNTPRVKQAIIAIERQRQGLLASPEAASMPAKKKLPESSSVSSVHVHPSSSSSPAIQQHPAPSLPGTSSSSSLTSNPDLNITQRPSAGPSPAVLDSQPGRPQPGSLSTQSPAMPAAPLVSMSSAAPGVNQSQPSSQPSGSPLSILDSKQPGRPQPLRFCEDEQENARVNRALSTLPVTPQAVQKGKDSFYRVVAEGLKACEVKMPDGSEVDPEKLKILCKQSREGVDTSLQEAFDRRTICIALNIQISSLYLEFQFCDLSTKDENIRTNVKNIYQISNQKIIHIASYDDRYVLLLPKQPSPDLSASPKVTDNKSEGPRPAASLLDSQQPGSPSQPRPAQPRASASPTQSFLMNSSQSQLGQQPQASTTLPAAGNHPLSPS